MDRGFASSDEQTPDMVLHSDQDSCVIPNCESPDVGMGDTLEVRCQSECDAYCGAFGDSCGFSCFSIFLLLVSSSAINRG